MALNLGETIKNKPMHFIVIIVTITIIFSSFISGLEFNTDFNDFTPDDPLVKASLRIGDYFGSNQRILIMLLKIISLNIMIDGKITIKFLWEN